MTFSSNKIGIKFEYPIESNKLVLFELNEWPKREYDPSGVEFSWSTRELGVEYGKDNFAWGASRDLRIGRTSVDIYNWSKQNGKYFIHSADGSEYEVDKILIKDTSFGTQALLYKSPCFFFCNDLPTHPSNQNNLIVNLPYNYNTYVESVIFKIPDSFSDEDVSRLVKSIQLLKP